VNHFVHRFDDVLYTEIETSGDEKLSEWEWHPFEAKSTRGGNPGEDRYGQVYAPYQTLKNPGHKTGIHHSIRTGIQDLAAGGDYAIAWKEYHMVKNKVGMLVTVQKSYPGKTSAGDAAAEKLGKNGIYYLATPCIETSFSYNTCVQDMLLQSWGNKIRVLPALPDSWKDVAFHNFRAEGAF
jgi:hypothetical protein